MTSGYTGRFYTASTVVIGRNFNPPAAPSSLGASAISSSRIDISWTDNSTNEAGFKIERKSGSGAYSQIATVGANVNSYPDTNLQPATAYTYRVKAYNFVADSGYSNEASATTSDALPSASTDPATNINGNSATLNATVNPNGLGTTVYFEWGLSSSYGYTTSPQTLSAEAGNAGIAVNLTALATNTVYHYRVVASNSEGTTYGSDRSFTTASFTLAITSPGDGDTIYRPDVMVTGTITGFTGSEIGVNVNGIIAVAYGNQFAANHVPLVDGSNTITVTATDTSGNKAVTAITVTAVTTGNYIRLTANPESGVVPLNTDLKIDGTFSINSSNMSVSGPGGVVWTYSSADEYLVQLTTEGLQIFTASVTGPDRYVYSDSVAVGALNLTQLDAMLRAKWDAMNNALSIGDLTTALTYIHSASKTAYQTMFNALAGQLPAIVATRQSMNLQYVTNNIAKYELVTLENGNLNSYEVTFGKDENGVWQVLQY